MGGTLDCLCEIFAIAVQDTELYHLSFFYFCATLFSPGYF